MVALWHYVANIQAGDYVEFQYISSYNASWRSYAPNKHTRVIAALVAEPMLATALKGEPQKVWHTHSKLEKYTKQ